MDIQDKKNSVTHVQRPSFTTTWWVQLPMYADNVALAHSPTADAAINHSRTMSPLDRVWKPGFSPDTSVFSALETFVIIALYMDIYHTIPSPTHRAYSSKPAEMVCRCGPMLWPWALTPLEHWGIAGWAPKTRESRCHWQRGMWGLGKGCAPSQKIYEFFLSQNGVIWCILGVLFWRFMCHENDSDLQYSEVPLKGKK